MDSPAVARTVVGELLAAGVTDAVLAPGSRSAPIALTLADAERRGLVRLHVRIDERSAAYLALGLAKVSGRPVAVVTTSGTAAVNLHPAMVEASYSGIPLIAITADRPGALRGSGANQTIDQRALYGVDAVASVDVEGLDEAGLRSALADALAFATSAHPGPAHVNTPLAEPLVATGEHAVGDVVPGPTVAPPSVAGAPLSELVPAGTDVRRGVLVAGDFGDEQVRERAAALASALGWPVISEPSGNLSAHPLALRHGPLILGGDAATRLTPDIVVSVGRVGLHRSVMRLLRDAGTHIAVDVPPRLSRVDPARTASAIVDGVPEAAGADADPEWIAAWRAADASAAVHVEAMLEDGQFTGPVVARIVAERAGADDLLVIGPSWPVRHVSSYAGPLRARCIGNRGTSGIDGVISTAWGAALVHGEHQPNGTTFALIGDLTAIYDRNGLLAPAGELRPRLDYVVIDNDGGGIFSTLEQGGDDFSVDFERVFGTPHGGDLARLLAAPRVRVVTVSTRDELRDELRGSCEDAPGTDVRVIIARCSSRDEEARLVRRVSAAVDQALSG